eukprot:COSAG01_NODE_2901_length_6889_cov_23.654741_2_plen_106_part_00
MSRRERVAAAVAGRRRGGGGGGFFRGSPKIRWDPEEEQRLVELVEATGTSNWHLKAAQLATGRTGPAVQQHWRVFLSAYQRQHGQMCVRACVPSVLSVPPTRPHP